MGVHSLKASRSNEDTRAMNTSFSQYSSTRRRLTAAAASLAMVGAVGDGVIVSRTATVLAGPVHVQSSEAPGFADVVERVSPAVVSVKVASTAELMADEGSD